MGRKAPKQLWLYSGSVLAALSRSEKDQLLQSPNAHHRRAKRFSPIILIALGLVMGGCGSTDVSHSSSASQDTRHRQRVVVRSFHGDRLHRALSVAFEVRGEGRLVPSRLSHAAGPITIRFVNTSLKDQGLVLRSGASVIGRTKTISLGVTSLRLSNLPIGTYTYEALRDRHVNVGTLIIRPSNQ